MTTSEDLLRDALDDLAPGAPADERAYAGIGRAITRRRRRRTTVRVAGIAAALLVAVGTAAVVARDHERTSTVGPPDVTTAPEDDKGPDPGTKPDGEEDPDGKPDDGGPVVDGTVTGIGPAASLVRPSGWEESVQSLSWTEFDTGARHPYTYLCLMDPSDTDTPSCAVEVFHGEVPGHEGFEGYDPEASWSWWRATDVMICPGSTGYQDVVVPVDGDPDPVEVDNRPVGGRDAIYSRWDVECSESGREFSPQGWYLPDEQILILDVVGHAETKAILDSFSFDDEAG
jgi:hypothetical protein